MIVFRFYNLVDAAFYNFFWTKLKKIVKLQRVFFKLEKMPAVFVPTFFIFFMMYICKVLTLNLHISQKDAYLGLLRAKGSKIYRLKK